MVAKGGFINNDDYNNAALRIAALLGRGAGQTGYGQRVPSAENTIANNAIISAAEWNTLIGDINRVRQHQANNNALSFTFDGVSSVGFTNADLVGADASGTSVTRDNTGEDFVINSPAAGQGVNDILSAISSCESAGFVFDGASFTTTAVGAGDFGSSQRVSPFGDANDLVFCELDIIFDGQYTCTDTDGSLQNLNGSTNDHRRHFFNTGGEINIKISLSSPASAKDARWQELLTNFGSLSFRANSTQKTSGTSGTTASGSGGQPAIGNYQLTTAYQQIAYKQAEAGTSYSENYMEIQARRVNQNTVRIKIILNDADQGDPLQDEDVLAAGGSITATVDLKRSTGNIFITEPTFFENTSFEQT